MDNIQNRTCNDLNDCGTELEKPNETRECCVEDWLCEWTTCEEGDEYSSPYDCTDLNGCGTEFDRPNDLPCDSEELEEIIQQSLSGTGCSPEWDCEDWGICEADYDVEQVLLEDITLEGIQRRDCIDETNCLNDRTEKRSCNVAVPIETRQVEWCEEDYVEIYEKDTIKLVSRIKQEKIGFTEVNSFDILFITGEFTGYCDYCYDGVQNYDEEGVDCGGPSCPACVDDYSFFDWLFWLLVLLWGGLLIYSAARIWIDRKLILFYMRDSTRQKSPMYGKGVEETMKGRKSPIKIIPRYVKKKKPRKGLFVAIERFLSGEPYEGRTVTEAGISGTKPELGDKSYSERHLKRYGEQKQEPRKKPIMKRIKEFFVPKSKIQKIKRESSVSNFAEGLINKTRSELEKRGF